MAHVLLGLTGSVASIKAPELFAALIQNGHRVRVVATRHACHFFDPAGFTALAKPGSPSLRDPEICVLDEDEWPTQAGQGSWTRGEGVLHIELRRWADIFLVAPLDATTLAKFSLGLSDNCLSCVWRAWEPTKPRIIAPAMNTVMWNQPVTARHLAQLAMDAGFHPGAKAEFSEISEALQKGAGQLFMASPENRTLACGDEGVGAMAPVAALTELVDRVLGLRI